MIVFGFHFRVSFPFVSCFLIALKSSGCPTGRPDMSAWLGTGCLVKLGLCKIWVVAEEDLGSLDIVLRFLPLLGSDLFAQ